MVHHPPCMHVHTRACTHIHTHSHTRARTHARTLSHARTHAQTRATHTHRHDAPLSKSTQIQPHLAHVPLYLQPEAVRGQLRQRRRGGRRRKRAGAARPEGGKRRKDNDPLQTFDAGGAAAAAGGGEAAAASSAPIDLRTGLPMPQVAADASTVDASGGGGGRGRGGRKFQNGDSNAKLYVGDIATKGTSGRQAWKMQHSRGKFNKRKGDGMNARKVYAGAGGMQPTYRALNI